MFEASDEMLILRMAGILTGFMCLVQNLILEPASTWALSLSTQDDRRLDARSVRLSRALMDTCTYVGFFGYGLQVMGDESSWTWPPSDAWWVRVPREDLSVEFRLLYLLYLARYVATCGIVFFLDTDRTSAREVLPHLTLSSGLAYVAYCCGYARVGGVTMVVFDVANICLSLSRVCQDLALDGSWIPRVQRPFFQHASDVWFVAFIVQFIVTRFVFCPYVIYLGLDRAFRLQAHTVRALLCLQFLLALLALQFVWFYHMFTCCSKRSTGPSTFHHKFE